MDEFSFYSISRINLQKEIATHFGLQKAQHRAKFIFNEVYKNFLFLNEPSLNGISKDIKKWMYEKFIFKNLVEIKDYHVSKEDSSVKFIMKLTKDDKLVESVLIPERGRLTLCVSTQVGCAQGCRFCQTGRMGLDRNLNCGEIVGQLIAVEIWKNKNNYGDNKVTNIVYMGMGEPLDNMEPVIESANIFCDPHAFFLSHNKVTLSTVGLLPQLDAVLTHSPICVALSLHSPFEDERTRVMPVNARHSLTDVLNCLKKHLNSKSRKAFLVQYTMLRGINDSPNHAKALINLLHPYAFKVNLIPLNEHEGTSYRRPDLGHVYEFQQILKQGGLVATIRLSKGRDIQAACGQLIKKNTVISSESRLITSRLDRALSHKELV